MRMIINACGTKVHFYKSATFNSRRIMYAVQWLLQTLLNIFNRIEVWRPRGPIHKVNILFKRIIRYVNSVWLRVITDKHKIQTYNTPNNLTQARILSLMPGVQSCVFHPLHTPKEASFFGSENISLGHKNNGGFLFSMMSRDSRNRGILVESSPGENVKLAIIPHMRKKIDRLGFKGNLLHVFDAIINGHR